MLQVDNRTALAATLFSAPDPDGVDTLYAIAKGTFDLATGLPVPEQRPLALQDEHYGDPLTTSVQVPSDVGLTKPATDVILIGSAVAPAEMPAHSVDVSLVVGSLAKRLRVHGDRVWGRGPTGRLNPGQAQPFVRMPLVWERAWGGQEDVGGELRAEPRNPIGTGYRAKGSRLPVEGTPVPNIEQMDRPIGEHGSGYEPVGVGPIPGHWEPRRSYAGTYDEEWTKTRAPYLPKDFDPRFLQVAPPDQVAPGYLRGGEIIEIRGVSPDGLVRFALPSVPLRMTFVKNGRSEPRDAVLDTVVIHADEGVFSTVWRASIRVDKEALSVTEVVVEVPVATAGAV